jgi:hypothetical protein
MSKRKFAADKIAKDLVKHDEEESESSDSADEVHQEVEFNPSAIRQDAEFPQLPEGAREVTRAELEAAVSEYEEDDDESDDDFDSDSIPIPEPSEVKDLEAELAELEKEEGSGLLDSLRMQQETDLRIAEGTSELQSEFSSFLLLRLKFQGILISLNALPPGEAFEAASADPGTSELLSEITESLSSLEAELHEMKTELEHLYGWDTEEIPLDERMMAIIAHWGLKVRLSGGLKRGSVINRPVESQIARALEDIQSLVQPSRHRDPSERIFGLESQPDVLSEVYNDYDWYKRLLVDFVGEKKPDAKVVVDRVKKQVMKSKQISYDVIPELQGFMVPSGVCTVRDDIDVVINSLLK